MEVKNQAELDAALAKGEPVIDCVAGALKAIIAGRATPTIRVFAGVEINVEARESSQPHVEARGYAQLSIFGRVIAQCSARVSVLISGKKAKVEGGQQTQVVIETPQEWCDYYGVEVKDGTAILFKALDNDFFSPHK